MSAFGHLAMQTEAEKAARKLCEEEGLDIVTIHPAFVLGPVLSARTDATSVSTFKARWAVLGYLFLSGRHAAAAPERLCS